MPADLFASARLGRLNLKNRIALAPMTRNRAQADGTPTDLMVEFYRQRASAGLLITEMTAVSEQAQAYMNAPNLFADKHVDAWRKVTSAVHEEGGTIVIQLGHGGRISHPLLQPNGALPVAPSPIRPSGETYTPQGKQPFVTPRGLAHDELRAVVQQFGAAAALAYDAGFDGVELHAANGYLLDQFLRDSTNRRTDEYGGSAANRARFLLEVAKAVATILGPDRVGVRLSPFNPYNDISDSNPVETFNVVAGELAPLSLAYLHVIEDVSVGNVAEFTAKLRQTFGGAVIGNGGHSTRTANEAIRENKADVIAFGVPYLANPDLPERLAAGAELNAPDPSTFYAGGARGYIDYPKLSGVAVGA